MRWGGAADKYEGGGGAAWLSAGRHINHHVSPSSSSSRWRHFSCIAFQPTLHYIVASCGRVHFWRSSEPARSGELIQGLAKKGGLKTSNHSDTPQSLSWHGLFPSQQTHGHIDQMVDFFRISSIYAQNQMITKGKTRPWHIYFRIQIFSEAPIPRCSSSSSAQMLQPPSMTWQAPVV